MYKLKQFFTLSNYKTNLILTHNAKFFVKKYSIMNRVHVEREFRVKCDKIRFYSKKLTSNKNKNKNKNISASF